MMIIIKRADIDCCACINIAVTEQQHNIVTASKQKLLLDDVNFKDHFKFRTH